MAIIHLQAFDECAFVNYFILDPSRGSASLHQINRDILLNRIQIRVDGALIGWLKKDAVSVLHLFRVDRRLIREKNMRF